MNKKSLDNITGVIVAFDNFKNSLREHNEKVDFTTKQYALIQQLKPKKKDSSSVRGITAITFGHGGATRRSSGGAVEREEGGSSSPYGKKENGAKKNYATGAGG